MEQEEVLPPPGTDGAFRVLQKVFPEDVVCSRDRPGLLGLVSQTADNPAEDDDLDEEPLEEGEARVSWLNGEDEIWPAYELRVVDRALMHGDLVVWSSDPLGQSGHVLDVHLEVDLEGPDQALHRSVPSSRLQHIRELRPGLHVVRGSWLGRVQDVWDTVHVQFDDSSVCKVECATWEDLYCQDPRDEGFLDEDQCAWYPGQRVKAQHASVFRHATWLQGSFRGKLEGCVVCIEPAEVHVEWMATCRSGAQNDVEEQPPSDFIWPSEIRTLQPFSYFSSTFWQLGDRALLRPGVSLGAPIGEGYAAEGTALGADDASQTTAVTAAEALEEPSQPGAGVRPGRGPLTSGLSSRRSGSTTTPSRRHAAGRGSSGASTRLRGRGGPRSGTIPIPDAFRIVGTRTTVKVQWQDGTLADVEARLLSTVSLFGEHDLWPNTFVEQVDADDQDTTLDSPTRRCLGIVQKTNFHSRMATVAWLPEPQADGSFHSHSNLRSREIEEISIYELQEHPDYIYRLGEVVLRLANDQEEQNDRPQGGPHQFLAQSWVGEVVGLDNGTVDVCWADGRRSRVGPEEVWVVAPEDEGSEGGSIHGAGSESSWETFDEEGSDDPFEQIIRSGLVDDGPARVDVIDGQEPELEDEEYETPEDAQQQPPQSESEIQKIQKKEVEVGYPIDSPTPKNVADELSNEDIPQYDEVEEFEDHLYLGSSLQPANPQGWQRRVLKDLRTLSRDLPKTIWVRSDSSHLGLMRAAILGAKGTPYHDNLFFFDIYLPPAYPETPPQVMFHSGGRRINPNLYENGKVCLSLLNTWNGDESEMWNPKSSTILQVLVSIQGLVLVPKPYYNEAGYESLVGTNEGEHKAALYNESTFLLSCRSMIDAIRKPPQHFSKLVYSHFRMASPVILAKVDQYLQGRAVGNTAIEGQYRADEPNSLSAASSSTAGLSLSATASAHSSPDVTEKTDATSVNPSQTSAGASQGTATMSLDEFEMPSSDGFRAMLAKFKVKLEASFSTLST